MGTSLSAPIRRQTSMPSRRGRPRSSTTRSGLNCSASVRASAPSPALRTSWPAARRDRRNTSAIASSSSTTSTRAEAVACSITIFRVDVNSAWPSGLEATFRRALTPGRGGGPGVESGGRMLADRIFGAPERRDPPKRKRQPARAQKRKGGARPRANARGRGRGRTSPEVMQRGLDLAGLCCMGLAVYLGYVIYLGWNGGAVGNGSQTALDYAVGAGGVVVPA